MQLLQVTVPLGRGSSPPPEPIIQDLPIIIIDEDALLDHGYAPSSPLPLLLISVAILHFVIRVHP